jgi:hypothetical protein
MIGPTAVGAGELAWTALVPIIPAIYEALHV